MKFLCTAVVFILPAILKVSASGYFRTIYEKNTIESGGSSSEGSGEESEQIRVASSNSSSSASSSSSSSSSSPSSSSSMTSESAFALLPKPAFRESDLAAIQQAEPQVSETDEDEPESTIYSTSSSGSPMSSTTSSSQPSRPEVVVYDGSSGKVLLRGSESLKSKMLSMTVLERTHAFRDEFVQNENEVMFAVLMSLKGQVSQEVLKERAEVLLPFCESHNNRMVLEDIISGSSSSSSSNSSSSSPSSSSSSSSSMSSTTSPAQKYDPKVAYQGICDAIKQNNVEAVRSLVRTTSLPLLEAAFTRNFNMGNDAMIEIFMSLKGRLSEEKIKEYAAKLLPYCDAPKHIEILSTIVFV